MKKTIFLTLFLCLCIVATGNSGKPDISFACELNGSDFAELFSDTSLVNELAAMKVTLVVGLMDFSPERTRVIQMLNEAGIPLVAWLLLPPEEGYWFNMYNGDKAFRRYSDFKEWTTRNGLIWKGIGIDLEPDINDARLALKHPWKIAWKAYLRLFDRKSLESGQKRYDELLSAMKADGFQVESYIIPIIFKEREKKTTSFQKLLGILDVRTEKEIPMLYTSVINNPGIIPFYHRPDMPIGLGSTGGGVQIEGIEAPAISWENLERDLLIASELTGEIFIFCLETSVKRGFLPKIKNFDFTRPAPDMHQEVQEQSRIDKWFGFILVILDHPVWLTICLIAIIAGIVFGLYRLISFLIRKLRG
jgi:hypothetical protein